ncbi:hypothetical protein ERX46_05975 [Brumimicrobium glaciale]|uniref:Uncharacterized protein n=1 Tax=Brumimicrobium glaciale TaxID=200475 RepID=A0A4Q4KNC1_9FLAO|nr:DUF6090 family protein [Brumimicrobium glaciale]RYM34921.1 hypothetical protein ERX46_05975 [Brumimicrobium glaciale]
MIKFFRKIRQKSLIENKFSKYLLYASGEIILVVIGILIALQVNEWNEESKKEKISDSYIIALQSDLRADVILLEDQIARFANDMSNNLALSKRLSSVTADIDTIIEIARYEFLPYFDPSNELNLSTFNALIATGNLDLLDKGFVKKIQEHHAYQLTVLKGIDFNLEIAANVGVEYSQSYPLNIATNAINGQILNPFWEQIDHNKLIIDLNAAISSKIFGLQGVNYFRTILLEKTKRLILEIDKIINEN